MSGISIMPDILLYIACRLLKQFNGQIDAP